MAQIILNNGDSYGTIRNALNTMNTEQYAGIAAATASTVQVTGALTLTSANAATYNGKVLEVTTALTITINSGLPNDFGFAVIPPASGNVTLASDGTTTLNGATTSITRAASSYAIFAVTQRSTSRNAYVVN